MDFMYTFTEYFLYAILIWFVVTTPLYLLGIFYQSSVGKEFAPHDWILHDVEFDSGYLYSISVGFRMIPYTFVAIIFFILVIILMIAPFIIFATAVDYVRQFG